MIDLTAGLIILWGCVEAAYLCVLFAGGTLGLFEKLLAPALAVGVILACVLCSLYRRWQQKRMPVTEVQCRILVKNGGISLVVLAVAGMATLSHFMGNYVVDLTDAVYEMAINTADSGLLMVQHPFTGQVAGSIPRRLQILGLSTLYAAVMDMTGVSAYTLMGQIIPVLIWLWSLGIFFSLGKVLLRGREKYVWLFVGLIAFWYVLTSQSEGMTGYRLFYAGFSGETIRACVLLPFCILACCRKQWLPALLAVVGEATLVWTTYGVGYCALVTAVFFLVTLWQNRRARA
ncbi:MAG: DUF6077 domain-containing protein [Lachnospiraceae bacterium]|nr:DUF6077 domain-containing protein [Lachnospiraceae bacterium]